MFLILQSRPPLKLSLCPLSIFLVVEWATLLALVETQNQNQSSSTHWLGIFQRIYREKLMQFDRSGKYNVGTYNNWLLALSNAYPYSPIGLSVVMLRPAAF